MIRSAKALFLVVLMGSLCFAQAPPETTNTPDNSKAGAYYNFAMGRLYSELAGAYGNRNDYVSKAIQHYQDALKLDPSAGIIFEELTDLYIQTNRLRDAVTQAEDLLKQNPTTWMRAACWGAFTRAWPATARRARSTRTT